jgi:carboxypeptidase Taq
VNVRRMTNTVNSGRLDKAHHPFESSLGPKDIRITTRYFRDNYLSSLFSTMHEAGHALYEQGLPEKYKGTPLGNSISLGIHESQSRFWENIIGRSREFAHYLADLLPEYLPAELAQISEQDIWKQTNWVKPSLIRVEADEVTYSLHVVIRMLLEEQLITGSLKIADLPDAWAQMYKKYLDVTVPDNKDGVLQDVHWYGGSLGYFPTYALGNLFGAMMTTEIRKSIADFDNRIKTGDFKPVLAWLRTNVHEQGMRYSSVDLIKRISGKDISEKPFIDYIKNKFGI